MKSTHLHGITLTTPVVHYPKFHQNNQSGALIKSFSTVMDICPTILDLAGIQHPAPGNANGAYRGREIAPMRGSSWVSYTFSALIAKNTLRIIR